MPDAVCSVGLLALMFLLFLAYATGSLADERRRRQLATRRSPMLVLTRKLYETVWINDDVCVTIVEIDRNKVRLGFTAPPHVVIMRGELLDPAPAGPAPLPSTTPGDRTP